MSHPHALFSGCAPGYVVFSAALSRRRKIRSSESSGSHRNRCHHPVGGHAQTRSARLRGATDGAAPNPCTRPDFAGDGALHDCSVDTMR